MKKLFLVLLLFALALVACDTTEPVDISPLQTQIAELQVEVEDLQQEIDDLALPDLWNYVDNLYTEVLNLWDAVGASGAEPVEVEYEIFGSDGRPMNDGAIQPVRSHIAGDHWILEFHIANFDVVNNADYFHIVPTSITPTGWVASSMGTCFADSANRDNQATGSAIWKRYGFSGDRWGLICAWDAEHGEALNLWGKGGSLRVNTFANGTGTEWIITVPWY